MKAGIEQGLLFEAAVPMARTPIGAMRRAAERWRRSVARFARGVECYRRGGEVHVGPLDELLGYEWAEGYSRALHRGHKGDAAEEYATGYLYGRGRGRYDMAHGPYLYRDGTDAFRHGWTDSGGSPPEFDAAELAAQAEARARYPGAHRLRMHFNAGARVRRHGNRASHYAPSTDVERAFNAGFEWQSAGGEA